MYFRYRKLHRHIWVALRGLCSTGVQPPPELSCPVLLATSWACLANCSKLFKLWSGQKAIFINLTSPSFLVFTVSLGFPPREPLAGLQAPRRVTGCLGLRGTVSPLQRWASGFGEPWAGKALGAGVGSHSGDPLVLGVRGG